MNRRPTIPIQAAQAVATSLAFAGLLLLAAVGRGVVLLLSPDSRAVFEQTSGDANSAAYSVILGYGVPTVAFILLYALVALRVSRGRRWTWVLGMLLSIGGLVLCFTTVSKLLSLVALVLGAFQVALLALLVVSFRYFWSSPAPADADADDAAPAVAPESEPEEVAVDASPVEAEPSS